MDTILRAGHALIAASIAYLGGGEPVQQSSTTLPNEIVLAYAAPQHEIQTAANPAQEPNAGHKPAPAAPSDTEFTRLIFADEFNSSTLDRSKWNVEGPGFWVNNEQQAYIDTPQTVRLLPVGAAPGSENGILVLQPRFLNGYVTPSGRRVDFVSGRINTSAKFEFTHGRAAARIRMPNAGGVWPAFWLLGNGKWPDTGEIDIMEYVGEKDWTGVALHGPGYSGETPLVNKHFFGNETDVTQWHIYSVEWTSNQMLFKVDGRTTYRVTRPMVEHYGKWVFDTPKHVILNFALGGAYPFKTNGIAKPYNGLPAVTVERIRKGEIGMEIDWVRVHAAD
jgi:beta-glucanase (GH16 family)